MKKVRKKISLILILLIAAVLYGMKVVRVNEGYGLDVTKVSMGKEKVSLQGYEAQVDRAEIYTLDQYYDEYPQVEYYKEANQGLYHYVLVAGLHITKMNENAPPPELTNFVFRMGNSFNQFDPSELIKLNGWTETQYLEVGKPFQFKIPYYISKEYFNKKQLKNLEEVDYRITWGVYPKRYEMCLNKIENWENIQDGEKGLENIAEEDAAELSDSLAQVDTSKMSGAEAYAWLLKEKGLTADNIYAVGGTPTVDGVTYEIQSVKQISNVSEIPDYKEEYQPQPEWMKEGADVPIYTEENDNRGDFVRKHHYILVELNLTNVSEKEKAKEMVLTGLLYETSLWTDTPLLMSSSESVYSTGGAITYKDSYSDYVVLQPGESKKVYALYDLSLDIDPTGENDTDMYGYPTHLLTEEEAEITNCLPLYFYIEAGLGGELEWENKGIVYVELDWKPEDGID